MKLLIGGSVLLAAVLLSSGASAEPILAKLGSPAGASKPIAGGAVFECLGDVCAARTQSTDTGSMRGCKALVRQVGPVSSFGPPSKPFAPEQLAACNEGAKK